MTYPIERLFFCYRITFRGIAPEEIYNFSRQNGFNCWGYYKADNEFSVYLPARAKGVIERNPALAGVVCSYRGCGLFPFLFSHRARVGLALGGALMLLFCFLSFGLVWDVRVEGNEKYTDEYLLASFAENGLSVGTPISHFDRQAFAASYLQKEEELAYLAVNFRGTVAYVQVLERLSPPIELPKQGGANLVAKSDAVIYALDVRAGRPLVHAGAVVKAGDGLVSGITEGAEGDRIVYATGEVIGRTKHTLTLEVPLLQTEKKISDLTLRGITLNFFGKELNIFKNYRNYNTIYDTMYKDKSFYVTENARLPISFSLAYTPVYEEHSYRLSEEEAIARALAEMNDTLATFLQDKELLSKHLFGSFDGGRYLLTCEIECLENIAVTEEFSIG